MEQVEREGMKNFGKSELVAACGIYCGTCHRYKKGNCPGCAENIKATWCKIRTCTKEKGYHTCAQCSEFTDVQACRKFNNIFAKMPKRSRPNLLAQAGRCNFVIE